MFKPEQTPLVTRSFRKMVEGVHAPAGATLSPEDCRILMEFIAANVDYASYMAKTNGTPIAKAYMILHPDRKGVLFARPGKNANEAWDNALEFANRNKEDGDKYSRDQLAKEGYRSAEVMVLA